MGRKKAVTGRYDTAAALAAAAGEYFASVSRLVTLTEKVPTGKKDEYGHEVYKSVSVKNRLGRVVKVEQWLTPPSLRALCRYIGVTEEDWRRMGQSEATAGAVREAEDRIEEYLRRELLTRPGKDVKGVLLTLQEGYGYGRESGGGAETLEELLRRMAEESGA